MNKTELKIKDLSDLRYKFLEKEDRMNDIEIDELADKILYLIKENINKLSFEFIFEELTKLGWAINLVYDDNGHFAVSGNGYQSLPEKMEETDDIVMYSFVEKDSWKDSIREALKKFLEIV
jgi:hypothetical protein